jgi:two-component system chemotaxis response regulator CheY
MRVLIADDEPQVCDLLAEYLRACDHEVVGKVTGGGLAAIRGFAQWEPDLVMLDLMMPKCNGFTTCHAVLSRKPETKVVLMSGLVEPEHPFVKACKASGFLRKPMLLQDVRRVLMQVGAQESPRSLLAAR